MSLNKWLNFFRDAGIQDESAASYAYNFHENKMDMTMLLDLDKNYLNDLGVDTLGDVIKVKKHAKKVAEKISTDKILNESSPQEKETQNIVKAKRLKVKAEPEEDPQTDIESSLSKTLKRKIPKIKYEPTEVKSEKVKSEPLVKSMASRLGPQQDNNEEEEDTKSSIFNRLGTTQPELKPVKKNVFDRLEPIKMEAQSLAVDSTKPSSRLVTSSKPSAARMVTTSRPQSEPSAARMVTTSRPQSAEPNAARMVTTSRPQSAGSATGRTIVKTQVKDEPPRSAFDRLDSKPDSTQVPKVSSSNEAATSSPDLANPNKGILKQRRAFVKSKSTSSIISLKARNSTTDTSAAEQKKRAIRVSFGSNDYRAVSPRQGIKTRLWGANPGQESDGGIIADSSDEEELKDVHFSKKMQSAKVDDLRLNIKKKQEAKIKDDSPIIKSEQPEKQPQLTFKVTNPGISKSSAKSDEINDDVVPTKKVSKKIYVIQTLSNGEKIKKEISPNDPLYRKYQNEAVTSRRRVGEGKLAANTLAVAPKVTTQQVSVRLPSSTGVSGHGISSRMDDGVKEVRRLKIVDDDVLVQSNINTSTHRNESAMRMDEQVSRLSIHNVGARRGESYTLEARAARVSAEKDDVISMTVSNPRSADLRNPRRNAEDCVSIRFQDTDERKGTRFGDDDVDEEIARKEQNISMIQNRISQSSKILKSTSAPSLNLHLHASPDLLRRDKPLRYDKAVDDVTSASRSRGGTMIADREGNQRPAIEDRLAAAAPSHRVNPRDRTRSRSRSPKEKLSGSSMMSRLGNAGSRNGDVSSRSKRNETSHYKPPGASGVRAGASGVRAGASSVRDRLGR